jgi:hypothetical protein
MKASLPSGLRIATQLAAVVTAVTGLGPIVAPKFFASIIGLPELDPIYQMAGGATLGYAVAAFLAMRATQWSEVRAFAAASFTYTLLSAAGAFYYVILLGAVPPSQGPFLIVILVASIYFAASFGYYLFVHKWAAMK